MANPNRNQLAFPKSIIAVDGSGNLLPNWLRFFTNVYQVLGGALNASAQSVFLVLQNGLIQAFASSDGAPLGPIGIVTAIGLPPVPQLPGVSPFVFVSPSVGTLVVESGQVEISRNSGATWYVVGLAGGAVPLLAGDQVRVTWYATPPAITFFPTQGL